MALLPNCSANLCTIFGITKSFFYLADFQSVTIIRWAVITYFCLVKNAFSRDNPIPVTPQPKPLNDTRVGWAVTDWPSGSYCTKTAKNCSNYSKVGTPQSIYNDFLNATASSIYIYYLKTGRN